MSQSSITTMFGDREFIQLRLMHIVPLKCHHGLSDGYRVVIMDDWIYCVCNSGIYNQIVKYMEQVTNCLGILFHEFDTCYGDEDVRKYGEVTFMFMSAALWLVGMTFHGAAINRLSLDIPSYWCPLVAACICFTFRTLVQRRFTRLNDATRSWLLYLRYLLSEWPFCACKILCNHYYQFMYNLFLLMSCVRYVNVVQIHCFEL